MNYLRIYDQLILNAKTRLKIEEQYFEKHHIIPRCMGGKDDNSNIVNLTAREHFIAHLCLVKIYPGNFGLVKAAMMMTVCKSSHQGRITNRTYEWLKLQHCHAMSESSRGTNNSQFGKFWICNFLTKEEKKVKSEELNYYLNNGWHKGRKNSSKQTCMVCNKIFACHFKKKTCSDNCSKKLKFKNKVFEGREKEFIINYKNLKSINASLKAMGFKGAVSHYYRWAKEVLQKIEQQED